MRLRSKVDAMDTNYCIRGVSTADIGAAELSAFYWIVCAAWLLFELANVLAMTNLGCSLKEGLGSRGFFSWEILLLDFSTEELEAASWSRRSSIANCRIMYLRPVLLQNFHLDCWCGKSHDARVNACTLVTSRIFWKWTSSK